MSRFTDDLRIRKVGAPPHTMPQLLSDLGVSRQSRDRQMAAVSDWLEANDPQWFLRAELEYNGFIAPNGGVER